MALVAKVAIKWLVGSGGKSSGIAAECVSTRLSNLDSRVFLGVHDNAKLRHFAAMKSTS